MAPEVLNGKKYNHKADVWSLGIVFFELVTGFTPFTGRDRKDLIRNLDKGDFKLPKKLKFTLQGLDFMNCCLQFDSSQRMSWKELIVHPYITTHPEDQNENNQVHLSYTDATGHYQLDKPLDESSLIRADPYSNLNEKNAILLNCKNPNLYQDIYKKTIEKHQKKSRLSSELSFSQLEEPDIDMDNQLI